MVNQLDISVVLTKRDPPEVRETEESLVRLEREATKDTEDSLACRVCLVLP